MGGPCNTDGWAEGPGSAPCQGALSSARVDTPRRLGKAYAGGARVKKI